VTALATAFVRLRVDGSALPGEIRSSVTKAAAPAGAAGGKAAGAGFSKSFGTTAVAGAKKTAVGMDGALLRGAVTSGLGYGKRFGVSMRETIGTYAKQTGALMVGFFAFEKVKDLFGEVIDQGQSAAKSQALTAAAIKSTGGVANVTESDIAGLAKRLSEMTGVEDDTVRSSSNLLLSFRNVRNEIGQGNQIFDEAQTAILNISAAMAGAGGSDGVDSLKGATIQVGKALNDPIRGLTLLQRVGVAFTDQQKKQITTLVDDNNLLGAQRIVLGELRKEFGGAAVSQATWATKAHAQFQNLEQDLGLKLMPLLEDASQWFATDGIDGLRTFGDGVATYVLPPVAALTTAGGDLVGMFKDLPDPVKSGLVEVGLLGLGLKLLAPAAIAGGSAITSQMRVVASTALFAKSAIAEEGLSLRTVGALAVSAGKGLLTSRAGALGLAVGLQVLDSAVGDSDKSMHQLLTVGSDVATGFAVGGPWGAALGAGVGILQLFGEAHKQDAEDAKAFQDTLDKTTGAVTHHTASLLADKAASSGLADAAATLGISQREVFDAILQGGSAADQYKAKLLDLAAAHTTVTKRGKEYFTSVDATGQAANQAADFIDSMSGSLSSGADSWRTMKAANDAANSALRGSKQDADAAGQSIAEATKDVVSLSDAYTKLNAVLSKRSTLRDYKASLDAADAALKDNGRTLNDNTEKGRANSAALDDIVAKALAHAQALKDDGKAASVQRGFLKQAQQALEDEAGQFFKSEKAAKAYVDRVFTIPANRITQLRLLGADSAAAKLQQIKDTMAAIRGGANIRINVNTGDISGIAKGAIFMDKGGLREPMVSGRPILWGEAGPESYIPLVKPGDPRSPRAIDLWKETGKILGARAMADGSVFHIGGVPALPDQWAVIRGLLTEFRTADVKSDRRDTLLGKIHDTADKMRSEVKDELHSARDDLHGLLQSQRQLSAGISQSFQTVSFGEGAPSTARDLFTAAHAEVNDAKLFDHVLHVLKSHGANPGLLSALAAAGPGAIVQAQALAGLSRKELNRYEHLVGAGRRAAGGIGDFVGRQVYGGRIQDARQEFHDLRRAYQQLDHRLDQLPKKVGDHVAKALDGTSVKMDGRKVGELVGRNLDRIDRGG
jgi:hypothetical protein